MLAFRAPAKTQNSEMAIVKVYQIGLREARAIITNSILSQEIHSTPFFELANLFNKPVGRDGKWGNGSLQANKYVGISNL